MQKLALITGAALRLGKIMAEHLARNGWSLAIHYNRSDKQAATLADDLKKTFPEQNFGTFRADLFSAPETSRLIPDVISEMGVPSLLINNASVFEPARIIHSENQFFDQQMNINLRAPFLLTRDFANHCRHGVIINLTDTRITSNNSGFAAYTLAKKALWELTKMSALELGPHIRVNAIAPGLTLPPAEKDEDYLQNLALNIAMKRPGGAMPVLRSIDYILENDYLTGQLLFCDGGENLGNKIHGPGDNE